MTQADLAAKLKVSVNTVCDWEQGRKPSVKNWHRLCQELSIPKELYDMDLLDSINAQKIQLMLLRRLNLPPEAQQIVEEALARYYGEELLHALPDGASSPRANAAAVDKT